MMTYMTNDQQAESLNLPIVKGGQGREGWELSRLPRLFIWPGLVVVLGNIAITCAPALALFVVLRHYHFGH